MNSASLSRARARARGPRLSGACARAPACNRPRPRQAAAAAGVSLASRGRLDARCLRAWQRTGRSSCGPSSRSSHSRAMRRTVRHPAPLRARGTNLPMRGCEARKCCKRKASGAHGCGCARGLAGWRVLMLETRMRCRDGQVGDLRGDGPRGGLGRRRDERHLRRRPAKEVRAALVALSATAGCAPRGSWTCRQPAWQVRALVTHQCVLLRA